LEKEVDRLRAELKTLQTKNFQLEEEKSKANIRATEVGGLKVTVTTISK
jgi:hypothetical protein